MKSTKTFTIEHEIYTAARATGANLSEIVEQALAAHVNYQSSIPSIYDVFNKKDDNINEFLNKMVFAISKQGFPGICKNWANMIKAKFNYNVDPYELYKFVEELVKNGR